MVDLRFDGKCISCGLSWSLWWRFLESTPELRQHRGSPGEPLDQGPQELAVEAQLAALGERVEVRGLDLEELHLRDRHDRGRTPRAVAGEVGHLAEAVALLEH